MPTEPLRDSSRNRRRLTALASAVVVPALVSSALIAPSAQAAPATPDVAALAGPLADQKLTWEKCDFGEPVYNERWAELPNIRCATVKVPRDWHDPDNGQTWDIRISQAHNRDVKDGRYLGTIFVNPGGPGGEGLVWGAAMQEFTPDLRPYYNYVGFDPRGVGQSSHAECEFSYDENSDDPYAMLRAAGQACSADPDVRTITTEQTVYDLDFIRHLLGARKLSYIGYSYGTWLGTWYENVFGKNAGRILLDSSTDGTSATLQKTWDQQPIARDRQFELHLMNWIARHDDSYGLGKDPQRIHQRYFAATEGNELLALLVWVLTGGYTAFPDNSQYPLAAEVVAALIELGETPSVTPMAAGSNPAQELDRALAKQQAKAPAGQKEWIDQARAKLRPLAELATVSPQQRKAGTAVTETLDSAFDFIRCNDGQWTQGTKYWENWAKRTAKKAPLSNQWGALEVPVCAFWQTNTLMPVATKKFPETIVLQGELDSQTAWEGGRVAGTTLPNTSFLAVDNEGSHGLFPYGTECVDRPIYNYFLKGKLPKDIKVCQARPLPQEDVTYESWARLNGKAKHVGGTAGPFQPVGSAGARPVSSALRQSLPAQQPEVQQALRRQLRAIYGADGVAAAEKAGVLD